MINPVTGVTRDTIGSDLASSMGNTSVKLRDALQLTSQGSSDQRGKCPRTERFN